MMKLIKEASEMANTDASEGDNSVDIAKDTGVLKKVSKIDPEEDKMGEKKDTDLNRQGLIRTVNNAHLIYKRENDTDTYDELWVYRSGKDGIKSEIDIKNDIIAATDIPVDGLESDDGEQYYEIWYVGEVIFLKIFNLPN